MDLRISNFYSSPDLDKELCEISYRGLIRKVSKYGKRYSYKKVADYVIGGCKDVGIIRYKQGPTHVDTSDRFFVTSLTADKISSVFSKIINDHLSTDKMRDSLTKSILEEFTTSVKQLPEYVKDEIVAAHHRPRDLPVGDAFGMDDIIIHSKSVGSVMFIRDFDLFVSEVNKIIAYSDTRTPWIFSERLKTMLYNFTASRHLFTKENMGRIESIMLLNSVNNE